MELDDSAIGSYSSGLANEGGQHIQNSNLADTNAIRSKEEDSCKEVDAVDTREQSSDDGSSASIKEVFDVHTIDPVLARKMALANKAIDEIGMTGFQWKMFFLNGFGYAVDSVRLILTTPLHLPHHHVAANVETLHSFWLSASQLRTLPSNRSMGCQVRMSLEFL